MTKNAIKAGVIGHPVAHSLSPAIHGYWLKKHDILGRYEKIDIPPEGLEKFLKEDIFREGYAGVNVTLPYKERVFELTIAQNSLVQTTGAVNTIVVQGNELMGDNTDINGFIANIRNKAPGFDFSKGHAVVLGAGGAARAIVIALVFCLGVPLIKVVNRTKARAEKLRDEMGLYTVANDTIYKKALREGGAIPLEKFMIVSDWENRNSVFNQANILINTTSLGMTGQRQLDVDLSLLPKDALVVDIVYNPLETELLKQAKARGNPTVDGLGMLLHQAAPGFKAWFGVWPEVTEELRREVIAALQKR